MHSMNDLTESDIKVCRNNRCSRFKVLIATTVKRCAMCDSKLKQPNKEEWLDDSAPVMIEGSTTTSSYQQSPVNMPPINRQLPAHYAKQGATDEDAPGIFSATTDGSHCDLTEKCPVAAIPMLRIPFTLYQNWTFLAHQFDVEWIAYHKGSIEGNDYRIDEEMIFPLQRARMAHVVAESKVELEGTIAAIHSHVDMNAYFSKEDRDHWNMPVEMVINRNGEMAANVRIKLECGRWARVKPKTLLTYTDEQHNFAARLEEKLIIEKEKSAVVVCSGSTTTTGSNGKVVNIAKNDADKSAITNMMKEKGWHVTQGGLIVMDGRGLKDPEAWAEVFKKSMDQQTK